MEKSPKNYKGTVEVDNERLGNLETEVRNLDRRVTKIDENMALVSKAIVSIDKTLVSVNDHIQQNNRLVEYIQPRLEDLMLNAVRQAEFKPMAEKVNNNYVLLKSGLAVIGALTFIIGLAVKFL